MTHELGYFFHPPASDGLGHPQLDINLYGEPTKHHFDPEHASFWVIEPSGKITHTTITHPWHGEPQLRVCAGRIILQDRYDKCVEAYSLGGNLEITTHEAYTTCSLTSPAPIVELVDIQTITTLLTSEFEALLAEKQAQWPGHELVFKKRLGNIEPMALFVAGLTAIEAKMHHLPPTSSRQQALHAINEAIHILQKNDRWPESHPTLDELLGL